MVYNRKFIFEPLVLKEKITLLQKLGFACSSFLQDSKNTDSKKQIANKSRAFETASPVKHRLPSKIRTQ